MKIFLATILLFQATAVKTVQASDSAVIEKTDDSKENTEHTQLSLKHTNELLLLATQHGNAELIKALLNAKADPNYATPETSLLNAAICTKNIDKITLLLAAKANVYGNTENSPVVCAIKTGNTEIVKLLLSYNTTKQQLPCSTSQVHGEDVLALRDLWNNRVTHKNIYDIYLD